MSQFTTGNPGGPGGARPGAGRKPDHVRHAARRIFGGVAEDDWNAIVAKAVEQAKDGDATARAWLTDRAFGRATGPDFLQVEQEMRDEFEAYKKTISDVLTETNPAIREKLLARLHAEDGEQENE